MMSRQMLACTLSLILTAIAPRNMGIAQAKEIEKNTVSKASLKEAESLPPFAHHPVGHGCMPPGPPHFGCMDGPLRPFGAPPPPMTLPLGAVDLSNEQIDKLAQLNMAYLEQIGPLIFKLHALEAQFRLALSASNLNIDDLNSLRSKIANQRVQLDAAVGDNAIAQAQALTCEQRQQIKLEIEQLELNHAFGPHFGPHE